MVRSALIALVVLLPLGCTVNALPGSASTRLGSGDGGGGAVDLGHGGDGGGCGGGSVDLAGGGPIDGGASDGGASDGGPAIDLAH